jgi:hypothetical protein
LPLAQAGLSSSSPPAQARSAGEHGGFLRVISPSQLDNRDREAAAYRLSASQRLQTPDLGSWIRQQWWIFRNHRNQGNNPLNQRLLRAQRMFEGKYDSDKLSQIQAFGGSEVYSRIVANKSRGATALLRDVYLGPTRPWEIEPVADPPIPPDVRAAIIQLIATEVQTLQMAGQPAQEEQVHMRYVTLLHSAQQAARRNAMTQADAASDAMDDMLKSGGFYQALGEFLQDLPLFPYAVLKGPVVRMVPRLTWIDQRPSMQNKPVMFWERVNPFDIYWSPGASALSDAAIIQRVRYTRADLNDLLGVPGYDEAAVRGALADYANGLREWLDAPDPEQAINEGREDPSLNRSQYIEGIEFHGNVQGETLLQQGVSPKLIPDADRDYMIQSWVVGRWTIKTQINPSPRQRHPFYMTSFEKVPGTVAGHALPDILEDIQEVANAAYRALVNNLSISSGPQVVVNDEMVSPTENGDELYPWKRWHVQGDPLGNQREPVTFFQPQSNTQELLLVINSMNTMADEQSAIPRYLTGESLSGGAGRTASGLSMLMGNAAKVLQTVAANVDTDVLEPLLESFYDMIMLTDTSGLLTGEEQVTVLGSTASGKRDTDRQKQLQALQITANPIDAPIIGEIGRARLLRAVFEGMGLPDDIVPDDQTLQAQMDAQKRLQAMGQAMVAHAQGQGIDAQHPGQQPEQPGQPPQKGAGGGGGGGAARPPAPVPPGFQGGEGSAQAQGNQTRLARPPSHSDYAPHVNAFAGGGLPHA